MFFLVAGPVIYATQRAPARFFLSALVGMSLVVAGGFLALVCDLPLAVWGWSSMGAGLLTMLILFMPEVVRYKELRAVSDDRAARWLRMPWIYHALVVLGVVYALYLLGSRQHPLRLVAPALMVVFGTGGLYFVNRRRKSSSHAGKEGNGFPQGAAKVPDDAPARRRLTLILWLAWISAGNLALCGLVYGFRVGSFASPPVLVMSAYCALTIATGLWVTLANSG